jgi:hypothetical protein
MVDRSHSAEVTAAGVAVRPDHHCQITELEARNSFFKAHPNMLPSAKHHTDKGVS